MIVINPDIVQATPLSPNHVQLSGLNTGTSEVTIWNPQGTSRTVNVTVATRQQRQAHWLHPWLGHHYFAHVVHVDLRGRDVVDSDLVHLASLRRLAYLDLASTSITNEGLEHLKKLKRLETLILDNTRVTEEELGCCNMTCPAATL